MKSLKRRDFIRLSSLAVATYLCPFQLTACAGFAPEPFVVGQKVAAPHGCEMLRAEDPEGDC